MLADLIVRMQNELNSHGEGYVQRSEDILGQVADLNDPACIADLLPMLDDDVEHDEIMFSIIHTIERFDDATFVRSVVDRLETFFAASPRWAVIVHMRILNSPQSFAAYADCIKTLPNKKRDVFRKVLNAVRKQNAKFVSPCDSLLAVI
jgi:hypothetical protein